MGTLLDDSDVSENSPALTDAHTRAETGKKNKFLKIVIGLTITGLILAVCLAGSAYLAFNLIKQNSGLAVNSAASPADEPALNQIAFVGNDENVWLVSPDGQNLRHLTTDGKTYRMPTWSPDGRRLAFIGSTQDNNSVLYITPVTRGELTSVFDKPDSAPFYLYWAPDSQTLTFLTQEKDGLAMRQVDVHTPGANRVLGEGAPFYWVWSPASDKLLIHVGGSRALSSEAYLSILQNQADTKQVELELAPGRFQAPVWSADGQYAFFIAADGQTQDAIYKMNQRTLKQQMVTRLDGFAFMVLSPTGKQVAYLQIERDNQPPFGSAYLIDSDGNNKRRLTDEPVGSIYWSPDGAKLALLTPARRSDDATAKVGGLAAPLPQELFFRWWLYDLKTNELTALISFSPTFDFLQTVPYFDQYHLSLTFWSPDSRYFVITKENPGKSDGTVWVVDTTGQEDPLQVGEGKLAVWSWQ